MPRISHLAAAAALLGGLAIAGVASADPRDGRRDAPPHGFDSIDFQAIDADGDGSLSRAELMARATARIALADTSKDGSLDRLELAAALPGPGNTIVAVFAASPTERLADRILAETGSTERGNVTVEVLAERQVNMLLASADTDRNAAISMEEADAMGSPRGGWHGGWHGGGHGFDREMRRGAVAPEPGMPPSGPQPAANG
jgi:Ca2+-binding EF-hand superfamily protein